MGGVFLPSPRTSAVSVHGFIQCVQMENLFSFIFSRMSPRIHKDTYSPSISGPMKSKSLHFIPVVD